MYNCFVAGAQTKVHMFTNKYIIYRNNNNNNNNNDNNNNNNNSDNCVPGGVGGSEKRGFSNQPRHTQGWEKGLAFNITLT